MENQNNEKEIFKRIKNDPQVWKFCFYGFFKNLKFFEPYLLIIFLALGYNLINWAVIIMVQEILTYIFEVPSGIVADRFGRKFVLMACFIFYIVSFVFFFMGFDPIYPNFPIIMVASVFFGLGEALRTGTHKAMELEWMEKEGLLEYKTFIYGRSRSYSLLGSTLSSILSIILLLNIPADRFIFLITIIPYIIDFFLIASYPSYMNKHKSNDKKGWEEFLDGFKGLKVVFTDKILRKGLFSISSYGAVYKSLKDYIQPIIKLMITALLVTFMVNPSESQENFYIKIILGLMYGLFYFISSYVSRNAYKFQRKFSSTKKSMDIIYDLTAVVFFLIGVFIWLLEATIFFTYFSFVAIIILYLFVYMGQNLRRPIGVDYLSGIIHKDQRATMLSVESLMKSVFVLIFSLIFGFVWEFVSSPGLFIGLAIVLLIVNRLFFSR